MPELPEVETSRAQVQNFVLNSTIVNCCAIEQGGGPVSEGCSSERKGPFLRLLGVVES